MSTLQVIGQRLEQQARDYGVQVGKTLTVEQYLTELYTGVGTAKITQQTYESLLSQYRDYKASLAPPTITPITEQPADIVPSTSDTSQFIKRRLDQQAMDYGMQIGRSLTVDQYLNLLQSQGGITQETVDTLLSKYREALGRAEPVETKPVTTTQQAMPAEEAPKPVITIPMTQTELDAVAAHNVKASCPGEMQIVGVYGVSGWDKNHDWVKITVQAVDEKSAEQKALDAGYDVKWVTRQIGELEPMTSGGLVVKTETLKGDQIPEDWRYLTRDEKEALGFKQQDGEWVVEVVKLKDNQVIPLKVFNELPADHQDIALGLGWQGMVDKFYVEVKDGGTGQMIIFPKDDWTAIDARYQQIVKDKGFATMIDTFNAEHVQSNTGEYMAKESYKELENYDKQFGTNYAQVYQEKGYAACVATIDDNKKIQDDAIAKLEKYKTPDGYNLLRARTEGITPEAMRLAGFQQDAITWANETYQESREMGVALPGEVAWSIIRDSKTGALLPSVQKVSPDQWGYAGIRITGEGYERLVQEWSDRRDAYIAKYGQPSSPALLYAKIGYPPDQYCILHPDVVQRQFISGISTLFFAPAQAALPEVKLRDITPIMWAVGGAQLATWAFPFVPKGVVPFISGAAAGIFGYSTATYWSKLSIAEKALAITGTVLVALPALRAIGVTKFIPTPTSVKIPAKDGGQIVVWRGVSVNGKPVIGISKGKPTLLELGIKRPTYAEIAKATAGMDWHPVTKIETTLLGTERALRKMGAVEADIARVNVVWGEAVPTFARQKPPTPVEPVGILSGSQRLAPKEVAAILKVTIQNWAKKIKLIYGSSTMRPQLKKVLRDWRKWHDIDIQTNMSAKEMALYTDDIIGALKKLGIKARVNPMQAGTIEKWVNGKWEKIVDIHAQGVTPDSPITAEGAYSYIYAESPIKIKLPGVGKLHIMSLSETGLRKAGSITSFQINEIAPAAHRINDIADLYVIVLDYKGSAMAEQVAKAFGYTGEQLLKVAENNPHSWSMWTLSPSISTATGAPSVSIAIPASLLASIPASLQAGLAQYTPITSTLSYMARTISSPATYSVSSVSAIIQNILPSVSPSQAKEMSSAIVASISPLVSGGVSPSKISSAISKSLSPYVSSGVISPSVSRSISKSVSVSVSVSPSVSPSISPSMSPTPSPSPSISPSPYPSPSPSPYPYPYPRPHPHPRPHIVTVGDKKYYSISKGSIAWRQGSRLVKGELRPQWYYIPPPWTQETPISLDYAPLGAKNAEETTPKKTIQMIGETKAKVPESVSIDLGVVDIYIRDYGRTIEFKGKGEETEVGKSLNIPTRGMSIPATAPMRVAKVKRRGNGHKKVVSSKTVMVG